jgi:hypothetical protein
VISRPFAETAQVRTGLAWQRTALSILAGALLLIRMSQGWWRVVGLVTVLVVAPATLWVVWRARPAAAADRGGSFAAMAGASAVLGLGGVVVVLAR